MTIPQFVWLFLADVLLLAMSAAAYESYKETHDAFDVRFCFGAAVMAVISIPLFA